MTRTLFIDYKKVSILRVYLDIRGLIKPRRKTGVCMHHQHLLAAAIKRARIIALLPMSQRIVTKVNKS